MAKLLPRCGAVDAGRFIKLVGNGLKPGQYDQGDEGRSFPHFRHDDCQRRKGGVREGRKIAGGIAAEQDEIEKPIAVIEDEAPHLGGHHRGDCPGNKDDGAQQPAATKNFVHHQRHAEADT